MRVREVINIALRIIGVSTVGIQDSGDDSFNNNFRQLQLVVDGLRNTYPYRVTQSFLNSELPDAHFVSIDAMVSAPSSNVNSIREPMRQVTLEQYNQLNINPNVRGWPEYYCFTRPYGIQVWPNDPGYTIFVAGKINTALGLTPATELDPSPYFFQDYLTWALAKRLAPFYKKDWTHEMATEFSEAKRNLMQNTDNDFSIMSKSNPNDYGRFRARYLSNA